MRRPAVRPRRTLRPTREGWWCLAAAVTLGVAAINTGNNLLYLLVSMLFGLIIVSGLLSEQSIRGLRVMPADAGPIHAGRPAMLSAAVINDKRWSPSWSITIEIGGKGEARSLLYIGKLPARAEQIVTWETTMPRRGRHPLPGLRITTRFPFGLFRKAGRRTRGGEAVIFPALHSPSLEAHREATGEGDQPTRRAGRGAELYNLREYVIGDDPRLIHWRSSAKASSLIVRELEAPTQLDTRIVLVGTGVRHPERLERGLSEAASLAVDLLRAGAAVELVGAGVLVPVGAGRQQERRVLTALALYDPDAALQAGRRGHSGARLREIRVVLG